MNQTLSIVQADLSKPAHQKAVLYLINQYACDPMGNGRPLINIHDFAVLPEFRSMGIGRKLMQAVEKKARAMKCCKLTLEVLRNNRRARHVYKTAGFGE